MDSNQHWMLLRLRKVVYTTGNAYEKNGRRVIASVPKETRAHRVRGMETDVRIVEFIKQHGNIGKSMLKPFIDAYAKELGIKTKSTIGK